MKASLQFKMSQQLAMTPQMQQAIRLLQLSTLDLHQEIQQALDSNPLLEMDEELEPLSSKELEAEASKEALEKSLETDQTDSDWSEEIPLELATDSSWDDVYQSSNSPASYAEDYDSESQMSSEPNLQEHLEWQLNVSRLSELDHFIGMSIIDAVNERGYLTQTISELTAGINRNLEKDLEASVEEAETQAVLSLIKQFDPVGVASFDLRECLMFQLNALNKETKARDGALIIVDKHIELLGNHDYSLLKRRTGFKDHQLQEIIELITSLQPEPGTNIAPNAAEYIVPDVMVRKVNDKWRVELNPDSAPKIRINQQYADFEGSGTSADNEYIKSHLQEARWFLKSLQSRNETLLKVAGRICEVQKDFLEQGEEAMKPLVLADVADYIEMHESTISRVTTQKYIHTPKGIFELKYFFSSHVATASGGECSSTAIRAVIKRLIEDEQTTKPLSDSKLAVMLEEKGIMVARRTVAKYRESMRIAPSNERKRLS